MKIQIDLKSAVCELIIGVAAMFAMGADSTNSAGRYQITAIPGSNPNQAGTAIMVDTQTGKAWGADIQREFKSEGFWDAK